MDSLETKVLKLFQQYDRPTVSKILKIPLRRVHNITDRFNLIEGKAIDIRHSIDSKERYRCPKCGGLNRQNICIVCAIKERL